jgi:hypothetical protein
MYHDPTPVSARASRRSRKRPKPRASIDEIVRAAYRKFSRDRRTREALRQSLDENSAKAKGKEMP